MIFCSRQCLWQLLRSCTLCNVFCDQSACWLALLCLLIHHSRPAINLTCTLWHCSTFIALLTSMSCFAVIVLLHAVFSCCSQ